MPRVADGRGLVKVAAGSREGPFLDAVIEVLREVGSLPDLAAPHAKHPDLQPVPLT